MKATIRKMDQTDDKIRKYIDILRTKINVELVIIFGSYGTPAFSNDSDIDILVAASEFNHMSKLDAYKILSSPIWDIKLNIDPIPVTIQEIQNYEKASFLEEILNTGRVIFQKVA